MVVVIELLMSGVGVLWMFYGIGVVLVIVLMFLKVFVLVFVFGMFIFFELNILLVVGGVINWYVIICSKDVLFNMEWGEKGILLVFGFIVGGVLMGVVSVVMCFGGINLVNDVWLNNILF